MIKVLIGYTEWDVSQALSSENHTSYKASVLNLIRKIIVGHELESPYYHRTSVPQGQRPRGIRNKTLRGGIPVQPLAWATDQLSVRAGRARRSLRGVARVTVQPELERGASRRTEGKKGSRFHDTHVGVMSEGHPVDERDRRDMGGAVVGTQRVAERLQGGV